MAKNKVEPNGPCPCGSGRKYKKCCQRLGKNDPFASGAPITAPLQDRIQQGYDAGEIQALELWLPAWDELMATVDEDDLTDQGYWLGDTEMELHNAALDDPRWGRRGIALYQRLLERYPGWSEAPNIRTAMADLHFLIGEASQGEAILQGLIDDAPDASDPYMTLARHLADRDVPRAIAVLEGALARPVRDTTGIRQQLEELRLQSSHTA